MNAPVPDPALSAQVTSMTSAELADAQPRTADQKPCSNPTCPLRYAHRGPCAPAVTAAVRRAMVVLGNQDPGWIRDALAAALSDPADPDSLARALFTLVLNANDPTWTAQGARMVWDAPESESTRVHWRAIADGLRMMLLGGAV